VHNGKCVRASAGSIFHVPIAAAPWPEALAALHARGLQVLATSGAGERELDELDLTGPVAWVLGNEARGLDGAVLASADAAVRIPLHGRAESLNVASAAAVCLYAAARQQRAARTEV
jgi:TrmH family RNA methyltransferase